MTDVESIFKRQAYWQRSRAALPWGKKLAMSVIMREAQKSLRKKKSPVSRRTL